MKNLADSTRDRFPPVCSSLPTTDGNATTAYANAAATGMLNFRPDTTIDLAYSKYTPVFFWERHVKCMSILSTNNASLLDVRNPFRCIVVQS